MQAYSSSGAPKWRSTAARACSTRHVAAADVGFTECGLPKTVSRRSRWCSSSWEAAYTLPPV